MAFTALATKVYKGPVTVQWAGSIQSNFDTHNTGVAKAWVNFDTSAADMSASIKNSFNIATIVDVGTGQFRVTFTTGWTDSGYVPFGMSRGVESGTNGEGAHVYVDASATMQSGQCNGLITQPLIDICRHVRR